MLTRLLKFQHVNNNSSYKSFVTVYIFKSSVGISCAALRIQIMNSFNYEFHTITIIHRLKGGQNTKILFLR